MRRASLGLALLAALACAVAAAQDLAPAPSLWIGTVERSMFDGCGQGWRGAEARADIALRLGERDATLWLHARRARGSGGASMDTMQSTEVQRLSWHGTAVRSANATHLELTRLERASVRFTGTRERPLPGAQVRAERAALTCVAEERDVRPAESQARERARPATLLVCRWSGRAPLAFLRHASLPDGTLLLGVAARSFVTRRAEWTYGSESEPQLREVSGDARERIERALGASR